MAALARVSAGIRGVAGVSVAGTGESWLRASVAALFANLIAAARPTNAEAGAQPPSRADGGGLPGGLAGVLVASPWTYLVGLPILASLPQLIGLLHADPLLRSADLTLYAHGVLVPGWPVVDPSGGSINQALGRAAARDWVHGVVPWWNPYSGIGLPLAGNYQPAAFFPLILLYLLPTGAVMLHVLLQIIAGSGMFALLGQLGVRRPAAITGGVLFGFNGTLVFYNVGGPALVHPFLPWALFAVERIRAGQWAGWTLLAAALALSLLAGFPETAYLDGLLILCWSALRFLQCAGKERLRFAALLTLGLVVALALSAPQLLAFAEFLPHALVGLHSGPFLASAAVPLPALALTLVAPYLYGPIYSALPHWPAILELQGNLGGYVSLAVVALAVFGLLLRRSALSWLLALWCVFALARTFGFPPAIVAWNAIPGISQVAISRYIGPSWELAAIVLAAFGIDEISRRGRSISRVAWLLSAMAAAALWLTALTLALRTIPGDSGIHRYELVSLLEAAVATAVVLLLVRRGRGGWISWIAAGEAVAFAVAASLSNPAHAKWDRGAVAFLKANTGLDRFYTLGPFQPNYGAYFGIPSLNYSYLPVARRWADWVAENLDSGTDRIIFNGANRSGPHAPNAAEQLRLHLSRFEWTGVRFIVTPAVEHSGAQVYLSRTGTLVYSDPLLKIYRLPNSAPYFDVVSGSCKKVVPVDRTVVSIDCRTSGVLVRRELFFPGWAATNNGRPTLIAPYSRIFQSVPLRAGSNLIRFSYAPPRIRFAWLAMAIGAALLAFGIWNDLAGRPIWRRRRPARGISVRAPARRRVPIPSAARPDRRSA